MSFRNIIAVIVLCAVSITSVPAQSSYKPISGAGGHISPNPDAPAPVRTPFNNDLFSKEWKKADVQWRFCLTMTFRKHYHIGISGGASRTPLAQYGNKDKKIRIHRNIVAIAFGYDF